MHDLPDERIPSSKSEGAPWHEGGAHQPPIIVRRADVAAFALLALLLICAGAVLYVGKPFFLPVVMAFVVGTMLSPAATFLERLWIPRPLAAVLIVTAVGAAVALVVGLIASPAMEWSNDLPKIAVQLKEKLDGLNKPPWQQLHAVIGGGLQAVRLPEFGWLQPTLEFVPPTFTEFLLFVATLILFIASWRDLRRALIMTFGHHEARLRALRILNEIEDHLGTYLLTVTAINAGVGLATGLVCALTSMPNPAGLGALAATLNFIPIIGPIATFIVLIVVGLIAFPTISGGLIAPLAFAGLSFLEGHFITPTIIGRRLALNALAVFLALAFWAWLWGPMGAFLSSPLLIVGLILREHLLPTDSPQLPSD